jgi:pimeloyl-ACP methyl ester carboxylesterase
LQRHHHHPVSPSDHSYYRRGWRRRDLSRSRSCRRTGNADTQLDLLLDYANNLAPYPVFLQCSRSTQVPPLVVRGKNDPLFIPAGADAFRRDNPNAEVHLLDTGHFARETHVDTIAAGIRRLLARAAP